MMQLLTVVAVVDWELPGSEGLGGGVDGAIEATTGNLLLVGVASVIYATVFGVLIWGIVGEGWNWKLWVRNSLGFITISLMILLLLGFIVGMSPVHTTWDATVGLGISLGAGMLIEIMTIGLGGDGPKAEV